MQIFRQSRTCIVARSGSILCDPERVIRDLTVEGPDVVIEVSNPFTVPMKRNEVDAASTAVFQELDNPRQPRRGIGDSGCAETNALGFQGLNILHPELCGGCRCDVGLGGKVGFVEGLVDD